MKRVVKTITFSYVVFEEGDVVTPSSHRCPLPYGECYMVTQFVEPVCVDEHGTVFVEGHEYGISAEYLTIAREAT